MKRNSIGDTGNSNRIFNAVEVVGGGDPIESNPVPMLNMDGLSLVLIAEPLTRSIAHDADDSVVALTGIWRFDNGAFTDNYIGGSITVSGASDPGNNGTFEILDVPDGTHVETDNTGLADETFDADVVVTVTAAPLDAAWGFEVANDFPQGASQHPGRTVHWAPMALARFTPTVIGTAAVGGTEQAVEKSPFGFGAFRASLTPGALGAGGGGVVSAYLVAKGNE